ncbi:hypothetical protein [Sphaerisporangium aureirubrum]|uniref:Uncharacterized protein n=1 Tax=Sphaerisporangium aureirubrum TaxID=1544736 RepID=A0ABW1NWI8_9ACTN
MRLMEGADPERPEWTAYCDWAELDLYQAEPRPRPWKVSTSSVKCHPDA